MKEYIFLARPKHYLKNIIIFFPIFFGGRFFEKDLFINTLIAWVAFCLTTSTVYTLNDLYDCEKDRNHPYKKFRPIASGKISKPKAIVFAIILFIISAALILFALRNVTALVISIAYIIMNILYSIKLKNVPLVDITILTMGFLIRLLFGGVITSTVVSVWLYLTVTSGSFFMALGKRRNELKRVKDNQEAVRPVLHWYSYQFLTNNMYVSMAITEVFFSLWITERFENPNYIILLVPLFMLIVMKYSLDTESNQDGNPVDIVTNDRVLLLLCGVFAALILALVYLVKM